MVKPIRLLPVTASIHPPITSLHRPTSSMHPPTASLHRSATTMHLATALMLFPMSFKQTTKLVKYWRYHFMIWRLRRAEFQGIMNLYAFSPQGNRSRMVSASHVNKCRQTKKPGECKQSYFPGGSRPPTVRKIIAVNQGAWAGEGDYRPESLPRVCPIPGVALPR